MKSMVTWDSSCSTVQSNSHNRAHLNRLLYILETSDNHYTLSMFPINQRAGMPAVETKKRPESGVRILIKITFKKR